MIVNNCRFIIEVKPGKIPARAFEIARRGIMDYTGVALAGSREDAGRIISDCVRISAGRGKVVLSGRFPHCPHLAALANGRRATPSTMTT